MKKREMKRHHDKREEVVFKKITSDFLEIKLKYWIQRRGQSMQKFFKMPEVQKKKLQCYDNNQRDNGLGY